MAVVHLDSHVSNTDASEYTFSGVAIGNSVANRVVIVGAAVNQAFVSTISGITVDGNAMTDRVNATVGLESRIAWFTYPLGAGNTTGDVVVSCGGTMNQCHAAVYVTYDTDGLDVPNATDKDEPDSSTVNLEVDALDGGFVLAGCYSGSTPSISWSAGVTSDGESTGEAWAFNVASEDVSGDDATYTITSSITSGDNETGIALSYAPGTPSSGLGRGHIFGQG